MAIVCCAAGEKSGEKSDDKSRSETDDLETVDEGFGGDEGKVAGSDVEKACQDDSGDNLAA